MRNQRSGAARAAALCAAAAAAAAFSVPAASAVSVLPQVAPTTPTTTTTTTSIPAQAPTSATAPFAASTNSGGRVVLPTGDTVMLSAAGTQVLPGGPSQAFSTYRDPSGDTYLVPAEAVPFAGRQLDLSLFDVSRLSRLAQTAPDGQIPVSLAFGAGVTPSAPAGVTLTAVAGQTATGYLTPASGAAFATDDVDKAAFSVNGQQVPQPPFGPPAVIVPNIGTAPATVRAVLDSDHPAGEKQSTNTHTDVTFQYTGQTDPWSTLPDGNYCPAAVAAGEPTASCQIMPILTVGYQYGALSQTNVSLSPVQSLVLDVGHHSFGGHGSHAPITSAQVSVSFDGGSTWQNVPTLGADGHYAALWRNPASGTPVTVRVTAADAVGGTITQTVANPYTVG